MSTFIAIYEDGQIMSKPTVKEIFDLPGKYTVFSVGSEGNHTLNDPNGICFYETADKPAKLRMNNLEWVDFKFFGGGFKLFFYDYTTQKIEDRTTYNKTYPLVIKDVLDFLKVASSFPDIRTYYEYNKLKRENENLKTEVERLKNKLVQTS